MEIFKAFIIENFLLFCISFVMLVNSFQRFKEHPKFSLYTILIISFANFLALSTLIQDFAQYVWVSIPLTTICAVIGYIVRPISIFPFILMSINKPLEKKFFLTTIPLVLNSFVYFLCFVPGVNRYVVIFSPNESGTLSFHGGPLRFSSHIISLCYLLWLLFRSFRMLKAKHLNHAFVIVVCALFVIGSVIIETFFNKDGDIHLLNSTIAISAMTYYLFLYIEKAQVDTLTGLFNRETYYCDLAKMTKSAVAIIQFDMNGLKYINDNFGHQEGDKALATIAGCILDSTRGNMYAYRLGGDEFTVIVNRRSEDDVLQTVNKFRNLINKTDYHCSIGYAYKKENTESLDDLLRQAEKMMYEDKEEFYKNAKFERRKALHD